MSLRPEHQGLKSNYICDFSKSGETIVTQRTYPVPREAVEPAGIVFNSAFSALTFVTTSEIAEERSLTVAARPGMARVAMRQ